MRMIRGGRKAYDWMTYDWRLAPPRRGRWLITAALACAAAAAVGGALLGSAGGPGHPADRTTPGGGIARVAAITSTHPAAGLAGR
jgi:hypothetical protein